MKLVRRAVLVGAFALVGFWGASFVASDPRAGLRKLIAEAFGKQIARNAQTSAFLADYLAFLTNRPAAEYDRLAVYFRQGEQDLSDGRVVEDYLRRHLFGAFLRATNVIRVIENGDDLIYSGLFDPTTNPCANQLGAFARTACRQVLSRGRTRNQIPSFARTVRWATGTGTRSARL